MGALYCGCFFSFFPTSALFLCFYFGIRMAYHIFLYVISYNFSTFFSRSDYTGFTDDENKYESKQETVNLADTVNNIRKTSGCC